ncbi:MAG: SRPBCC family protein [Ferruginibacter sp.]
MPIPERNTLTVTATIKATPENIWKFWTEPEHIVQWNNASDDWYTPRAENDLREGGRFVSRMESTDGTMGFDFSGTYLTIRENELIEYLTEDGRKVTVIFEDNGDGTTVTENFETENTNPEEMQQQGWQNILDNFKKYAEGKI